MKYILAYMVILVDERKHWPVVVLYFFKPKMLCHEKKCIPDYMLFGVPSIYFCSKYCPMDGCPPTGFYNA
jgi:hypothetical protein